MRRRRIFVFASFGLMVISSLLVWTPGVVGVVGGMLGPAVSTSDVIEYAADLYGHWLVRLHEVLFLDIVLVMIFRQIPAVPDPPNHLIPFLLVAALGFVALGEWRLRKIDFAAGGR